MNFLKIRMIQLFSMASILVLLNLSVLCVSVDQPQSAVEEYTFSLSNANTQPIWIGLFENEKLLIPITEVQPKKNHMQPAVTAAPDIRKSILLAVWFTEPENIEPKREGKKVTPEPDQLYAFTPGKTLYLTWRKLGNLTPQAGMLWGLMPESREGFNLKFNVNPSDVIQIEEE